MKNRFSQKKSAYSKFLCYNGLMLKTKTKVKIGFVGILSIAAGVQASAIVANQVSAETTQNTTFQVNVVESLTVTLTTPEQGASGNIKTFLRNKINLAVTTNNTSGFLASMYSDNSTTDLTRSGGSETIPTVSSDTARGSVMNKWGYSLGGESWGDTEQGDDTKTYKALQTSSSPIAVLSSSTAVTSTAATRDIYFGTRTNAVVPSGTYAGTVVINVVTGPHDTPVVPSNPAHNTDTTSGTATYDSSNGRTVYTNTSGTATTAEVSAGDTTNTYNYAPAQGVTERTTASIASGTPLATGLAVTAAVAATSGAIFFILAKRKKDDDEEEDDENMV